MYGRGSLLTLGRIMNSRDQAYLEILGFGLLRIRECAALGLHHYCAVEADHLHNIPSLIGETNEKRHEYYIREERGLYLERVDRTIEGISFTLNRYAELWPIIEQYRNEN